MFLRGIKRSGLNGRYGIVSPSSLIDAGSTTSNIKLKRSYGNEDQVPTEGSKYSNLIGYLFTVRNSDWTFSETRVIEAIDPSNLKQNYL